MKSLNVLTMSAIYFQFVLLPLYLEFVEYDKYLDGWMVFFKIISMFILTITIPITIVQIIKK